MSLLHYIPFILNQGARRWRSHVSFCWDPPPIRPLIGMLRPVSGQAAVQQPPEGGLVNQVAVPPRQKELAVAADADRQQRLLRQLQRDRRADVSQRRHHVRQRDADVLQVITGRY